MQPIIVNLFAMFLSLLGPAPTDTPKTLQLPADAKIVAIGDSITSQGLYLRDIDAVLTQQYPDLKIQPVVNKGISGQVAEQLVVRFAKDVVAQKPAVVTINVGINDVWHRLQHPHDPKVLEKYKENVAKMVDMAQAAGIKVILLTPTVIQENPKSEGNIRLPLYVDAMKEIAVAKKCQIVDLHQMFLEALAKRPSDVKGNWLTADGVHPKPTGAAIMAIGVLRALGVPDDKIRASEPPAPPVHKAAHKSAAATGEAAGATRQLVLRQT